MYRNLSARGMGISGRQSEIIELALTYHFRGFDFDILDYAKRCENKGDEYAQRFFESSKIKVGGWDLPVPWQGEEATYKADLAALGKIA